MPPKIPPGSLCQKCNRRPAKKGRSRCPHCAKGGREWTWRMREVRTAKGLCRSCGRERAPGKRPCQKCLDKGKKYWANGLEKRRAWRYGLTPGYYDEMLKRQLGICAICGNESCQHVDHDHATGKVRGLLCQKCNSLLGMALDNVKILLKAVDYLESHKA